MRDATTSAASDGTDMQSGPTSALCSTSASTSTEVARAGAHGNLTSDLLSREAQARLEALIAEFDPLGEMLARARRRRREEREASRLGPAGEIGSAGDRIGENAGENAAGSDRSETHRVAGPTARPKRCGRDLRLPSPGSFLRREYRGRDILVRVLDRGFEYDGRRYRSLSAIAKAVTGAHWNGLLFFGLARQEKSPFAAAVEA